MVKNTLPISSFLWSNLDQLPLVLSLRILNTPDIHEKGILSSPWLPLKHWEAMVRSYWDFSSPVWANLVPSTFLHMSSLSTSILVALHWTHSNFSVSRGQDLDYSAKQRAEWHNHIPWPAGCREAEERHSKVSQRKMILSQLPPSC